MSIEMIDIRVIDERATIPTRAHEDDAGLDLYASEDAVVTRGTMIPTGVAVDIPPGYEGTVRPRSGLSVRESIRVTLGTVDSGFSGEVNVIADNYLTAESMENGYGYRVYKGDKIAQLVISPVETPRVNVVEDFASGSERGSKGFGSSDEKETIK